MENNFDDEEKKYFSNRMFLNKLGDTREFGNFYELIYNRKVKILSFLNKDLNQINNPDFRQFESLEHAYELFLSYHIFYPYLYEDYLFMHSLETYNFEKDMEILLNGLETVKNLNTNVIDEHGFAAELLLFHEQQRLSGGHEIEEESVDRLYVKRKTGLNRRNTIIRLKAINSLIDLSKGIRICDYKFVFKILFD